MAVAHDAATESHTGTTGWTTTPDPFTFDHTPVGVPRGVLLFCFVNANEIGAFVSASYGGVAMTAVPGGEAVDTATEPGRCKAFFLGANIPAGTQTVSIDHSASANVKYAVVVTVTAAGDTQIIGTPVLLQDNGTLAEQNVDSGAGTTALRYAGINSGLPDVPPAGSNSTALQSIDFVARVCATVRETTAGAGSRPVGFYSTTSDDRAAVHLAICEVVAVEKTAVSALEAAAMTLQTRPLVYEAAQATVQSRQPSYETAGEVLQARLSPLEATAASARQVIGFMESLQEAKAAAIPAYESAGQIVTAPSIPWEAASGIITGLQAAVESLIEAQATRLAPFEIQAPAGRSEGARYESAQAVTRSLAVPWETTRALVTQAVQAFESLASSARERGAVHEALASISADRAGFWEAMIIADAVRAGAFEALLSIARSLDVPYEALGEAGGPVSQTADVAYETTSAVVRTASSLLEALAILGRASATVWEAQASVAGEALVAAEAAGRVHKAGRMVFLEAAGPVSQTETAPWEGQAGAEGQVTAPWEVLQHVSAALEAIAEAIGKVACALAANYEGQGAGPRQGSRRNVQAGARSTLEAGDGRLLRAPGWEPPSAEARRSVKVSRRIN